MRTEGVSKRYADGTWANRDVSLTIKQGEILTLLGPNGAGKTTLVRHITTELLQTSGEIRVLGLNPVSEPNAVKALLGVVPQDAGLYWDLSAKQHFRLLGKMRGLPGRRARARADELVRSLGLEEHADKATQTLSGGLKRRVMNGIATCAEPPVLVLDEPTTGLDPRSPRDLWALIREYKREGRTVLNYPVHGRGRGPERHDWHNSEGAAGCARHAEEPQDGSQPGVQDYVHARGLSGR